MEDWEYSPKLEQLSINVRVADDVVDKIELKMAKERGEAALAAINENIKDLVAARKRAKREAKRQAKIDAIKQEKEAQVQRARERAAGRGADLKHAPGPLRPAAAAAARTRRKCSTLACSE